MFKFNAAAATIALGLAAVAMPSSAEAASASATVVAKVLKPLVMAGGQTVDFGSIVTPSAATFTGTFPIDAAATQTTTYCATGFVCTGTPKAAMFNLQGSSNNNITLSIPLSVTLTLQGATGTPPTLTMTTKNSIAANNTTGNYTMTLPNSGFPGLDFYVGGSITLTQATVAGTYGGTINVTADYQ